MQVCIKLSLSFWTREPTEDEADAQEEAAEATLGL